MQQPSWFSSFDFGALQAVLVSLEFALGTDWLAVLAEELLQAAVACWRFFIAIVVRSAILMVGILSNFLTRTST